MRRVCRRSACLVLVAACAVLLAPSRVLAEPLDPEAGRRIAAALVEALNAGDEDAAVALFDVQATVAADRLEVWDSVLVDRDRIVAFMSQPTDASVRALLGETWCPDDRAEPMPAEALTHDDSAVLRTLAGALGLLTVAAVLGAAALRRPQAGRTSRRHGKLTIGRLQEFADARRLGPLSVIPAALVLAQLGAPDPADPLVVVESFLAARDARDALGATTFCANTLAVFDSEGQWIGDTPAVSGWLRRLTDTYVIDTLVRPHADGERVVWTERLVSRGPPFPGALATALEVKVEGRRPGWAHHGVLCGLSGRFGSVDRRPRRARRQWLTQPCGAGLARGTVCAGRARERRSAPAAVAGTGDLARATRTRRTDLSIRMSCSA